MAAALLGKSVGLIALILLLHGCHAFKVREHQASVEHQHRATCASIFGRCTEKSPSSRKWHETTAQRLASFRRPPAEVTSGEDNDTGAPRGKVEKTGRPVDRKTWRSSELDDDDDEAVVEVEEDTAEVASGRDPEDSGEKQIRKVRRSVELDDEDDETDSDSGVEVRLRKSSGEDVTRTKKSVVLDEDSEDDEEEEEDETEVSEDAEDEEEEDEEEEEEDEDDDEGESKPSAPPLRKLEKVRHADKDKVRSVERSSIEKPTVEEKKPVEPAKVVPTEKVPAALEKPIETSKKVEPPKVTKSVSESSKPKSMPKEEKKEKVPVRTETKSPPTTREQLKQPAEAKRIDKEAKPKTKTHVGAPYTLADLNDAILRVPTFVPNFTAVEDFECQQHGKIFLRQLRGYKLWALQMLDSGAKIPSSLLRGNFNQLGDFDQCLGVLAHVKLNDTTIKVQGKYCLANVDMYATHPDMKLPVHLMQARNLIRSMMRDTGHFVPRFTTINWALCLPAACSAEHAQRALEQTLNDYNNTVGVRFVIDVDPNMCYVKQTSRTYSKETIGVLYFYAMVVCLVIVATLRDYIVASNRKANYSERIIMSFSLRRTMKSLWDSKVSNADVTCIHGIRTIGMIMLYSAHKVMPLSMIPMANRIELTELTNSLALTPIRAVTTFTESFLLISGVLTAYNMAHEFTVRGEIRWFCRFITRYIRLTSPLLAVLFWYAFVMEHTGSGPQWNNIIMKNAELCKSNAWTNFLYIQNFFPFLEMCATHTHQLALDMQLSLLAPMLVFFLEIKPIIGVLMIFFFILSSATFRYVAGVSNSLSLIIYNGMSSRQIIKTAELTYSVSWHRTTPYAMGVGLGVLLYHTKKDVKIHKVFVVLGWLIATTLLLWSLYSPWRMSRKDYVYNVEDATNYAVFYPVTCSLAVCWIIFACHTNNGGIVNRILTNYWCIVFSRMSYAIYLTQFVVFFYNVGSTRYPATYSTYKLIDQLELAIVIAVSMILTLLFDIPMQEVRKVIMETTDVSREGPSDKKSSPETGKQTEKLEKAEQTQKKVFEEDEVASTGWDWQKDIVNVSKSYGNEIVEDEEQVSMPILKKPSGRRQSFIAHDPIEDDTIPTWDQRLSREEEYRERGRRNGQRDYQDSDDESEHSRIQPRRSLSRSFDAKRMSTLDRDEEEYRRRRGEEEDRRLRRESRGRSAIRDDDYRSWEFVAKERSSSRGPDPKRFSSKSDESAQRQSRPLTSETKRVLDSEEQPTKRRQPSVEPRISDEEDWESELRIRRKQFMEKLAKEEESVDEEDLSSLRRRSSAEGKLALLKDPSADDNMDSWTISVGSRVAQLGSSQERSEAEEEVYLRREYREKAPPMREDTQSEEEVIWDASKKRFYIGTDQTPSTSVEEDEDNFVLTKDSRRISLQDLSKLSQEDSDLAESEWNVVKRDSNETQPRSLGLFKRESIIKSQASEEDPEYLLPERPKLVQQEREHPFKKAWQMQKSRSEEDGSYSIKEAKEQSKTRERKNDESSSVKRESSGEQYEDGGSFADDECESITLPRSRSTDTEETKTDSRSEIEETESVSTERSKSISIEDNVIISGDVEEEDLKFGWPSEAEADDDYDSSLRMQSEDTDSNWDEDDT